MCAMLYFLQWPSIQLAFCTFQEVLFRGKKCFCLVFCFVIFLWRHGLTLWPRMAWNSVSDIGWPRPQPQSFSFRFRFRLSQLQRLVHMGVGVCAEARGQTLVSFLRMIQPGFFKTESLIGSWAPALG